MQIKKGGFSKASFENKKIKNAKTHERLYKEVNVSLDSGLEAYFFDSCILRKIEFELKPKLELTPKFVRNKKLIRAITYTPDFKIGNDYIDVKGFPNDVFPVKRKLLEYYWAKINDTESRLVVLKDKKEINEYFRQYASLSK